MGYLIAFTIIGICIILFLIKKTWISPDVMFCLEWGIITTFASFHLFGMYEASSKTYLLILLGTISYLCGICLGRNRFILNGRYKKVKLNNNYNDSKDTHFMKKSTFWKLIIILYLLTLYSLIESLSLMQKGYSLGDIREASYGIIVIQGYNRNVGAVAEFIELAKSVTEMIVVATGVEYFLSSIKKNKYMLVSVVLLVIMGAFSTGGRFAFANFIVELIVCYGLYRKKNKYMFSRKIKRWIRRIIFIMGITMIVITLVRGAEMSSLVAKYYRYLCGNVKFLDLHIQEIDQSGFYSNGFAGFYGLWSFVLPYTHKLGLSYPQTYLNTIEKVMNTQQFIHIGDKMSTNAFITPFYHLYADARWIGVFFGMLIFGFVVEKIYRKAIQNMDGSWIVCYLIVSQMIFKTLQSYPFSSKNFFWCVIVLGIVMYVKKKSKKGVLS